MTWQILLYEKSEVIAYVTFDRYVVKAFMILYAMAFKAFAKKMTWGMEKPNQKISLFVINACLRDYRILANKRLERIDRRT